jgi:hypothetical protein
MIPMVKWVGSSRRVYYSSSCTSWLTPLRGKGKGMVGWDPLPIELEMFRKRAMSVFDDLLRNAEVT